MNANGENFDLTAEEIIRLCRAEIETLHNLQYLLTADADSPHQVRRYAAMLGEQLGTMTDLLCRKAVGALASK
jgi:hypothetical protein